MSNGKVFLKIEVIIHLEKLDKKNWLDEEQIEDSMHFLVTQMRTKPQETRKATKVKYFLKTQKRDFYLEWLLVCEPIF